MSTPENPESFNIKRTSPIFTYKLGRTILKLTYSNTTLFEFDEPYDFADHVYVIGDDDLPIYIFGNADLMDELNDAHYPRVIQPYPQDDDLAHYVAWEGKKIGAEAQAYLAEYYRNQ